MKVIEHAAWRAVLLAIVFTLLQSLLSPLLHADSPLTSTPFYKHYQDVHEVAESRFDDALIAFLLEQNPIDHKAAAINALGWTGTRDFAGPLLDAIAVRKGVRVEQMRLEDMSAEEAFVFGYLRAMDEYLYLTAIAPSAADVRRRRPMELLDYAKRGMPESFTVAFVAALVDGQKRLNCQTYRVVERVIRRFPTSRRDMRPRAVEEVLDYINIYEDLCSKVASKTDPEFNQIYSLARLGTRIAAGTQAGLVLWDPASASFEAHALGICSGVTMWRDNVWADCQKGLYRHDGIKLTKVLASGSRGSSSPRVGPDGKLYVFENKLLKRFDKVSGPTTTVRELTARYHDAAFASDGSLWGIVFMQTIVREGPDGVKVYERSSPQYPGRDPRRFYHDPSGSLWVVDFGSGFFRFDPQQRRFVQAAKSPKQASDILVDAERGTVWLLGYRGELVAHSSQADVKSIPLGESYYRDMMLDADGSIWIAGWTRLLHLEHKDGKLHWTEFKVNPTP